jgi:outer membrane receptor protein involved in Fe transport
MASFRARRVVASLAVVLSIAPSGAKAAAQEERTEGADHREEQPESGKSGKEEQPSAVRPQASEEIQVLGHYENAIGTSDAASAGKITRQLMEDRPILRPGEVLELVPGLIITQHSGSGKANQYFLRGFNLDHGTDFATTLDGVPVNLRTHAHGQGYTDLNFLIPELIDHVDYYKGPYFASKGDFASAGAADIHYAAALPKNLVELTGGNFLYGRALAAGSPGVAGGKLLYALELFHNDGPWDHPDDYRRVNGVLRYSQPVGEGRWAVTAMGYYGIWNATDQIPERAVQSGLVDRFGSIDPTDGGKTYRFSLSGDYHRQIGDGVFHADAYAVRYKLNLFSNFTYFLDDPDNGDQFEQADDRWLLGTSGGYEWSTQPGEVPLRAQVGWDVRYDRIDPVGLYHTVARGRIGTVRQDFARETSGAVFAEAEAVIAPWLKLIAGARYDHYFFDVTSDNSANSASADAGRISPKISAVLGPWARTELFANFGLGFHSNDARGVTTTVDPKSGGPVMKVTPLVGTQGEEVGVRTQIVRDVQASLALWRLDLDSELLFTGDAGTTEPSRASRRQGVELSAHWQPIRWLLFDLDFSWSRTRFTTPDPDPLVVGNHIPGAIETALSAGATLHDFGGWSASAYVRYFGPRPLKEDDSVRSSASTILNAQVSYGLTKALRLTLDVFNLLDAQVDDIAYYYTSRLRDEPDPVTGIHFHPAESRSVRVTTALRF